MYQIKSNLVALPPLTKLSVKFKRNRLPNVQDITFFSIRPSPNFCLINLFMSSLSPAALRSVTRGLLIISKFKKSGGAIGQKKYGFQINLLLSVNLVLFIYFKNILQSKNLSKFLVLQVSSQFSLDDFKDIRALLAQ